MKKQNSFIKDILEVVISVAVITFVLLKFILMPCQVHGTSMVPTLYENDFVYSFIISKNIGINRFDICVVDTKLNEQDRLLVKRVIGLPNETIEYKNNRLYINEEYVKEDFIIDKYTEDFKIVLGEDEYFCLGDNREVSRDSRYYGAFTSDEILATKMFVLYPFNHIGVKK